MRKIELNLTFDSEEEAERWEEENCPDMTYEGRPIMLINKSGCVWEKKVKIESILVI